MPYIFTIRTTDDKRLTFRIDALTETEARARLEFRLPPEQRDSAVIEEMQIDLTAIDDDDAPADFEERDVTA